MSSSAPRDGSPEPAQGWQPVQQPRQTAAAGSPLAVQGPMVSAYGSGGVRLAGRDLRRIAIWQLTGPMERLLSGQHRDDVPSAPAVPVWYFAANGYPPENKYDDASALSRSGRVYHVGAFPGDQRQQIAALDSGQPGQVAIPRYGCGDRVYAEFNNQSGRWEIIGPAEDIWRFELKTALVPNANRDVPSTAQAYLVVYDPAQGRYVRTDVEFPVADFLDIWDAPAGCRGYAKRLADSQPSVGWEVVMLETASGGSSSGSGI